MKSQGANFSVSAVMLIIGIGSLVRFSENMFHFSQHVRNVDIVGLSGGGAACGAAIVSFVWTIMARNRERPSTGA